MRPEPFNAPSRARERHGLAAARAGSLHPGHVILLGPGVAAAPGERPMRVAPGAGVPPRRDASAGARALARCPADAAARLAPGEGPTVPTPGQEAEPLGWDAERRRRALDRP